MTPFVNGLPTYCFSITPSDTTDVKGDVANYLEAEFVILHNPGDADVSARVLPAATTTTGLDFGNGDSIDDRAVTINVPAGGYSMLHVRRVYATNPTVGSGDLLGMAMLNNR